MDRYGLQKILIGLLVLSIGRKLKPPAGVHHKRNYLTKILAKFELGRPENL